jgi:hypothetical protein
MRDSGIAKQPAKDHAISTQMSQLKHHGKSILRALHSPEMDKPALYFGSSDGLCDDHPQGAC